MYRDDEKVTMQELAEMFGESMPIQALQTLQSASNPKEARQKLREIARLDKDGAFG